MSRSELGVRVVSRRSPGMRGRQSCWRRWRVGRRCAHGVHFVELFHDARQLLARRASGSMRAASP
eukprot:4290605-Pyramimonas_sp.AAC.1